jgi:hypothetical protein
MWSGLDTQFQLLMSYFKTWTLVKYLVNLMFPPIQSNTFVPQDSYRIFKTFVMFFLITSMDNNIVHNIMDPFATLPCSTMSQVVFIIIISKCPWHAPDNNNIERLIGSYTSPYWRSRISSTSVKKSQIFNKDECKYLFLPFQLKSKPYRFHSFIRMSMCHKDSCTWPCLTWHCQPIKSAEYNQWSPLLRLL